MNQEFKLEELEHEAILDRSKESIMKRFRIDFNFNRDEHELVLATSKDDAIVEFQKIAKHWNGNPNNINILIY